MLTKGKIKKLKKAKHESITYKMIANACVANVSEADVKRFFSFRSLPFAKQLEIIKVTKQLQMVYEEELNNVLAK